MVILPIFGLAFSSTLVLASPERAGAGYIGDLRKAEPLRGFSCSEADERTRFFCSRDSRSYWAVRLG